MVTELMRCGALLDVRNNNGDTPLMVCIQEKQKMMALSMLAFSRMGPAHTRVY